MTPSEREDAVRELEAHRDWRFAFWLVLTIQLVAEKYPDELRAAIGKAFDLSGYEREVAALGRRYQRALRLMEVLEERVRELESNTGG